MLKIPATHATELSLDHPGFLAKYSLLCKLQAVTYPRLNVLKFKIEFEIQHAAHTMVGNDPDLQAFESNLRRILPERKLGKAAALVSNLPRTHQTLNRLAYRATTMLDANPPVAYHLSQIWRIYLMITKHPQNGSSKSIFTLKLAAGP